MERIVSSKEIKWALRRGGRIDGSSFVLKRSRPELVTSGKVWGVHRPPYLLAAYQFEPHGERWPDKTEPSSSERTWAVREFERLSLAARASLATRRVGAAADAIVHSAKVADLDLDAFPVVYAEDILEQLAHVADELGPDQGRRGRARTTQQLAMRGGLQLIGCRITTRRSKKGKEQAKDGVRLVNARLPISLRFIGCVFECPLLLAHCELVSLDISGSALDHLDATGLKASGSVYMRRTVVRTPVSFSAARIAGSFNASDAVLAPMASALLAVPVNPDHGILNLSGATIENEVRLERARLWGGLSLRGAVIGRSLYLTNAVLMSPIALMEKRLGDLLEAASLVHAADPPGEPMDRDVELARHMAGFDRYVAEFLHAAHKPVSTAEAKAAIGRMSASQHRRWESDTRPERIRALGNLEVLQGETDRWRNLIARTLLKLSGRALGSALRADSLKVDGSLNARGLVSGGQFRMKYAQIKGAVRFDGALLRSAEHYRAAITAILKREATHEETNATSDFRAAETIDGLKGLRASVLARIEAETSGERAAVLKLDESALRRLRAKDRSLLTSVGEAMNSIAAEARGSSKLAGALDRAGDLLDRHFVTWRMADLWRMLTGDPKNPEDERAKYFEHQWNFGEPWAALNLRDSSISGDLSLGKGADETSVIKVQQFRDATLPVEIYGSVLLESLSTGGSVLMPRLRFHDASGGDESEPETRTAERRRNRSRPRSWQNRWARALFPADGQLSQHSVGKARTLRAASGRPQLLMRQATLGRDLDLRRSNGLLGIDLENATIGGDLKFCDVATARDRRGTDLASSFYTCDHRAEQVRGLVSLRSAKVAGDAFLVFDSEKGPRIDARMAVVGGRLEINPQVGAISYQLEHPNGASPRKGFWLDACDHVAADELQSGAQPRRPGRICRNCAVVMDAVDSSLAWEIDLSRARTTVFAHPPAAWPDPGALRLEGFVYQQVGETGPLQPRHRVTGADVSYFLHRWQRFVWRGHEMDRIVQWATAGLTLLIGGLWLAGGLWRFLINPTPVSLLADFAGAVVRGMAVLSLAAPALVAVAWTHHCQRPEHARSDLRFAIHVLLIGGVLGMVAFLATTMRRSLFDMGSVTLVPAPSLSFIILLVTGVVLATSGLRLIQPGWQWIWRWPFLHSGGMVPRAIEYLQRQRANENRFKWRSASHPVLETYLRAAKVLREAGRFISANSVEEERLRLRTKMLSWRHHGAAKLALKTVDVFAGYGFRLWRATVTITVLICAVAALGHLAAAEGFLVRQAPLEAPSNRGSLSGNGAGSAPGIRPACGRSSEVGVLHQDCPDFVYAADLLLTFIDLKEADRWRPTIPDDRKYWFRRWNEPWQSLWASLAYLWPSLVSVLGLLLTGIIGVAAAARISAALARIEE